MKLCRLTLGLALSISTLTGCGDDAPTPGPEPKPFALEGAWTYLGPSDGAHDLTITRTSMQYVDVDGKWSSSWTITTHDDDLHHFQVAFLSGTGTYLPVGRSMSGTYEVSGFLTIQLAIGASFPLLQSPGSCTDTSGNGFAIPDCRLYVKKQ